MGQHLIKKVKSPVNKFDAVNKAYVDHIKYITTNGIIPNIASEKIIHRGSLELLM